MAGSNNNINNSHNSPSPPSSSSSVNGQNLGLSLFTSTMASLSANKLLSKLAQQNQMKASSQHQQHHHQIANSAKRKLAEKMLLNSNNNNSDRLSPSDPKQPCDNNSLNNNNFNVNNLNLEKRVNGHHHGLNEEYSSVKNFGISAVARKETLSPSAIKNERISPVTFNYGGTSNNTAGVNLSNGGKLNGGGSSRQSRSRSSTPSSFNNGNNRELSPLSRSQQSSGQQLSNQSSHHPSLHPFVQQQQLQSIHQQQSTDLIHGLIAENLQQSMIRQPEQQQQHHHQARNYSDIMRSLAAKYNNSNNE